MGRKEPNPPPPTKNVAMQRMAGIFNEWARRYSEDKKSFTDTLDSNGKPVEDYGDCCALYFRDLANEMDAKGLLPRPTNA